MMGFNWIDLIIVGLVIGAVFWGLKVGFAIQLGLIIGFFGGLFVGGWLFPHLLPIHDRTISTVVNGSFVLLLASYSASRGMVVGRRLHKSLKFSPALRWLEEGLGTVLLVCSVLVAVWLAAAIIGRLPFAGFSNSTDDAFTVQLLDDHLPAVPAVLAEFDRLVNPNQSPYLFVATPKLPANLPSSLTSFQPAAAAANLSTVRITSFGCGAIAAGSGFVVANDLIATNAHVVAGVKRPIIKYQGRSYAAVPVLFNSNLDFALLRVPNFPAAPLALAPSNLPAGTDTIIAGYPDGSYSVLPGVVRINEVSYGRNIYDEGVVGRDLYVIQASLDPGSSGSPALIADGRVAGIIFGRSTTDPNYSFAISSTSFKSQIQQVKTATRRVSTGVCLAS